MHVRVLIEIADQVTGAEEQDVEEHVPAREFRDAGELCGWLPNTQALHDVLAQVRVRVARTQQ